MTREEEVRLSFTSPGEFAAGQRVRLFILANLANFVTTREEVRAIGARLSRIESPTPCHLPLTLEIFPQMDKLPHRGILLPTLIVVVLTILSEGYIGTGPATNHTT
jgi:hypothetical protein